jgi:hypothetical protein
MLTPRPSPVMVTLPDGSPYIIKRLLSSANARQRRGYGYVSVGLTLTPRATGRSGRNLCPYATRGCAASCFADYDRMAWPKNKKAAVARTLLLASDPDRFIAIVKADIAREEIGAGVAGVPLVCRLNVVSDVAWEREHPVLFHEFPKVHFMDYTKDASRILEPGCPKNYHLTFSRSENNEADCLRVLDAGNNVTVVFRRLPFPSHFWGRQVIDGDEDDLRFLDAAPRVIGLRARGNGARRDRTGFVIDYAPLLPNAVTLLAG